MLLNACQKFGFLCRDFFLEHYKHLWARIAQSVQELFSDWTVRGSDPGEGEIFCTRPNRPWGPPIHLHSGYQVIAGVKRAGRGVDHPLL